jgi:AraC-like DNA-binding protein
MPDCLMFHVVTAGRCLLEDEDACPRLLEPGVFALVPHGEGHSLLGTPDSPAADLFDLPREQVGERYEILRHGGGGAPTTMICGAVRFDHPAARQLVGFLPRRIIVEAQDSPQADWMQSTLQLMAAEAGQARPGGEALVTRLADILVIQAIRTWMETDPAARTGWLGALQDAQIGRALALIHRQPEADWTVSRLAAEVAMSRSAFAARFTELVGDSPMHYLAQWRMHMACSWLQEEDVPLIELSERLGYQSEAAFSRAFKRVIGITPGAVRRSVA